MYIVNSILYMSTFACTFILLVVSPDAIHVHVKTTVGAQETERLHYAAPEFALVSRVETTADIYAFGICALEVIKHLFKFNK